MNKERKIEILELMKVLLDTYYVTYGGLCEINVHLHMLSVITVGEYNWINNLIFTHRTIRGKIFAYYWKKYKKAPRIAWLNKRIKELDDR